MADTLNYVVFLSQFYTYTGGAHGGIGGDGDLTFSKVDGKLIEHFVDSTKVEAMQPLLREGLKSYFAENGVKMTDNELFENLQIGISASLQVKVLCSPISSMRWPAMQLECRRLSFHTIRLPPISQMRLLACWSRI